MAILDEIARLTQAKQDFKTKLIEKGVAVSDDELISDYPPKLDLIKGGTNTSDATATANEIRKGFTAYVSSGKVEGAIEDYDGAFEILVVLPEEPEEPDFSATSELVYTLSDDGTYYIVGTGFTDVETLETATSGGTAGSGLDSTWAGGELYIPNTYNDKPVKGISRRAFEGITNITKCHIQDGITHIGSNILSKCNSLEELIVPFIQNQSNVDKFPIYPLGYFFGNVSYSGGVATEQTYCISGLSSTASRTYYLPNTLKKVIVTHEILNHYAFSKCTIKLDVELTNVTKIGNYCFESATGINRLIIRQSDTVCVLSGTWPFVWSSIEQKNANIYVPDELVDSYKAATNWSVYASQIKPLSELEE